MVSTRVFVLRLLRLIGKSVGRRADRLLFESHRASGARRIRLSYVGVGMQVIALGSLLALLLILLTLGDALLTSSSPTEAQPSQSPAPRPNGSLGSSPK